jgi:hypothetical protein
MSGCRIRLPGSISNFAQTKLPFVVRFGRRYDLRRGSHYRVNPVFFSIAVGLGWAVREGT